MLFRSVYIGLGSVWFSDFQLAHRQLGCRTMISIEADPVTASRARYNKPFRTVDVVQGESAQVLPGILRQPVLKGRPTIVWLDYDKAMDEDRLAELADLIEILPENSLLLSTFSASGGPYGQRPDSRPGRLRKLFGAAAPDDLSVESYKGDALASVLASCSQDYLLARAQRRARVGSYVPAFMLTYRDGTPMVTVGGFLPSEENLALTEATVASGEWIGIDANPITVPPLTPKEALALQELLPRTFGALTRADVRALGFDLEDGQVESFERHYLRYPTFFQAAR